MRKHIFLVVLVSAVAVCLPSALFAGVPEVNVVCPTGPIVESVNSGECQALVSFDVSILNVFGPLDELRCSIDGVEVALSNPVEGTNPIEMTVPVPGGSANCTVTDRDGNAWSCLGGPFNVSIVDDEPPIITVPPDVTLECGGSTVPSNTGVATATDNCGDPTITFSDVVTPGACPQESTITRTWTATDYSGNTASAVQLINVVDNSPPVLTSPADVTLECGEDTSPSNTGVATATDNCGDPTITFSDVVTPGACPQIITRTWTATDDCGNSSSAVQLINVVDTTVPDITVPPDVTLECGESTSPSNTGAASAPDGACGSPVITWVDVIVGSCPQIITRTWTATDDCGNSSSAVQLINVVDTTPPVITCPPDASSEDATATDNCTSVVAVSHTDSSGGIRTWTATDDCGNSDSCDQLLCEASDPMTAGYWHRQCLGVPASEDGLDPGRKGKGPKAPTETGFVDELMPCADDYLDILLTTGEDTCSGIDTDLPSDDCERAKKQLTALVLNWCSERLDFGCPICLDNYGVNGSVENVADLIEEVALQIEAGTCKQAAEMAALVNEGEGLCVLPD